MKESNDSEFQRTSLNWWLYHLRDISKQGLMSVSHVTRRLESALAHMGFVLEAPFAVMVEGVALSRGWYKATPPFT